MLIGMSVFDIVVAPEHARNSTSARPGDNFSGYALADCAHGFCALGRAIP